MKKNFKNAVRGCFGLGKSQHLAKLMGRAVTDNNNTQRLLMEEIFENAVEGYFG